MKKLSELITGALEKILLLLVLAFILAFACPASAQVTPGYTGTFTNLPAVFTSTNTVTSTTNVVVLRQNSGLALQTMLASPGVIPSGLWIWFSVDGTNYPSAPTVITVAPGTTAAVLQTNYSAASLAGFYSVKVQLTNGVAGNLTNSQTIWRQWPAPLGY